jgi:hypothetical protein
MAFFEAVLLLLVCFLNIGVVEIISISEVILPAISHCAFIAISLYFYRGSDSLG